MEAVHQWLSLDPNNIRCNEKVFSIEQNILHTGIVNKVIPKKRSSGYAVQYNNSNFKKEKNCLTKENAKVHMYTCIRTNYHKLIK